jgi:hypothetical protein
MKVGGCDKMLQREKRQNGTAFSKNTSTSRQLLTPSGEEIWRTFNCNCNWSAERRELLVFYFHLRI